MRKTILILLLILLVAFAAVSCTSRDAEPSGTAAPTTETQSRGAATEAQASNTEVGSRGPTSEPSQTESFRAQSDREIFENVCTFTIECSTVLDHPDLLDSAVSEYIPVDGVILSGTDVAFGDGETVCDALRRVCAENGIALETAGALGGVYVEGIGHLYEFDCGSGSGWMYRVNGEYPNYGCDSYVLSPGDVVEWKYTCDFGADVGGPEAH